MLKVKNQKIIRKISTRSLLANKKKNLIAVMAIMLTCILFTAVFCIGGSIMKSTQESTFRQVGGTTMASLKCAVQKDYDILEKDPAVKDLCRNIQVGRADNKELSKVNMEINYADDLYAKMSFNYPETGAMPSERLEIATSSIVLEAMGIPLEIGQKVPLEVNVDGKVYKEEFTLCGFWEGDPVAMAQECWVSRQFADEVAPEPSIPFAENQYNYAGYSNINFNFAHSWDIEGQLIKLLERNGYDLNQVSYGVNWAYTTSKIDAQSIALVAGVLIIIMLSGYLIIYNVFYINVTGEIHEYGLLKTIGTTAKQLKQLVRRQAVLLSLVGIPMGMILGTLLAKILFPIILDTFLTYEMVFSINPIIYMASIIFTFVTVLVSCRKPCRLASKVSPIEALRYTENFTVKKKVKKSRRVSTFTMAVENVKRSRKKVFVVVLSLSMSMILVNSIYNMVHSFDMEAYISNSITGDFQVTHSTVMNLGSSVKIYDGISQEELAMFRELDGVESVAAVYADYVFSLLDEEGKRRVEEFVNSHERMKNDSWLMEELENGVKKEGYLYANVYGIDMNAFETLSIYGKDISWEEFNSGSYCLLYEEEDNEENWMFGEGDKITLQTDDGAVKEYEVLAVAKIPYSLTTRSYPALGISPILPEGEYLEHSSKTGVMNISLRVFDDKEAEVESFLSSYTENGKDELVHVSRQTYVDQFEDFVSMFWIVGGALSFILALIGILNFINAIVTGILTRKQEFAMMEAVGMTRKQLRAMLVFEGLLYAGLTIGFSLTVGNIICGFLVNMAAGMFWFFKYSYVIWPVLVCAPVLVALAALIPYGAYGQMSKDSIVERLKLIE